jgi:hypothetical protein
VVTSDAVDMVATTIGSHDYSALVAERVVSEALTGLALRRCAGSA